MHVHAVRSVTLASHHFDRFDHIHSTGSHPRGHLPLRPWWRRARTPSNIVTFRTVRAMAQAASSVGPRAAAIERKMREAFQPVVLNIIDDSHQHAGHAGNPSGDPSAETHLRLEIVSPAFEGKSLVQRHKSIYALLDDEFKAGLHALSLQAKTPKEVGK